MEQSERGPAIAEFRAELRAWVDDHADELAPPFDAAGHARRADRADAPGDGAPVRRGVDAVRVARARRRSRRRADPAHRARRDAWPHVISSTPACSRSSRCSHPRSSTSRRRRSRPRSFPGCSPAPSSGARASRNPTPAVTSRRCAARPRPEGDPADPEAWVINGQKVWTSLAPYADRCVLLTRTGPVEDRHRGITAFFVDMDTPGITVAPIEMLNGVAGVRGGVLRRRRRPRGPRARRGARRLGGRDEHPPVRTLVVLLAADRLPLPPTRAGGGGHAPSTTATPRPSGTRSSRSTAVRARSRATQHRLAAGRRPSAPRRRSTRCSSRPRSRRPTTPCAAFSPASVETDDGASGLAWRTEYLYSRAATIYGGTAEVQRNIIARRLLDLGPDE